MKIKNKIFILILLLISFFLNSQPSYSSVYQWTYDAEQKLNISKTTYQRLHDFITGNFYSYTFKKKITLATPLYFAITENGQGSVLSYCEDERINCIASVAKFQTLARCKKKFLQNCYILAIDNKVIANKKIFKINKKKPLDDLKNISYFLTIEDSSILAGQDDIHYYSIREVGDSDWGN